MRWSLPGTIPAARLIRFPSPGPKVSEVRAVTLDRQGNLLVTENDFGYVRIVRRLPTPPCG